MALELTHQTLQDDTLTHQVRFMIVMSNNYITCNCRRTEAPINGSVGYDPIARSDTIERSRKLYNDPVNHWAPFNDEDKAKW